jgi:hypothetical protein
MGAYALMAIGAAERTASLRNVEELKTGVPDQYNGDISNAVREVSRLFNEAASALNRALDDLKCM